MSATVRDWGVFRLHVGDCRVVLAAMPEASVDSVVCDPPYDLTSARPGGRSEATRGAVMGGFMGLAWDSTGVAFDPETWRAVLRVLKPGGHLLAFSGSRTYHRMACAIEGAGFEIRDQIMWIYGSGFPKSLDVSKSLDKAVGAVRDITREGRTKAIELAGKFDTTGSTERERRDIPATDAARQWQGWGTALKPAHEPICMARKPLIGTVASNVLAHGTGAINVDGCRVGATVITTSAKGPGKSFAGKASADSSGSHSWHGCVESTHIGRWPANLIHDGSNEVLAAFPQAPGQLADAPDSGTLTSTSAARFFYCAKARRTDRNEGLDGMPLRASGMVSNTSGQHITRRDGGAPGPAANHHPTVKPTELMRYLCRLVTPPGGVVLDPFTGSGSTGKAAVLEGFRFVGCEQLAEYVEIAERRIAHAVFGASAHGAAAA